MAIKLFFSFAEEDKKLATDLRKHLTPMERSGAIIAWCENDIQSGLDVKQELQR